MKRRFSADDKRLTASSSMCLPTDNAPKVEDD
jgi:hypothetical protein